MYKGHETTEEYDTVKIHFKNSFIYMYTCMYMTSYASLNQQSFPKYIYL